MDNRKLNQEIIIARGEHLLSALLLLFHNQCKQMSVSEFKNHISHIPLSRYIYKSMQIKKVIGVHGSPANGYKVQYSTSVHPNIEMCTQLIREGLKVNSERHEKKVVKKMPETMITTRMSPQEKLLHDITAMKTAFEKQHGARVEILVEIIMTTVTQI